MNANELKKGNYIKADGLDFLRVDEIRPTEHQGYVARMYPYLGTDRTNQLNSWIDLSLKEAQPIPLTPELLTKCCGFKKFASGNYYHSPTGFELTPQFWLEGSERAVKVESLHRLQNLYFALTGEELKIALQQ